MKPKVNHAKRTKFELTSSLTSRSMTALTVCFSGPSTQADNPLPTDENAPDNEIPVNTCAFCKNTFDGQTLEMMSVYPICSTCKTDLENKIFPLWVKLFFGGIIALVIFSLFWNLRFYAGYLNLKSANQAFIAGNSSKAELLMSKAADEVPEATEVRSMAYYFKAIDLLKHDKSTEALKAIEGCQGLPGDFHIKELRLQAEMGSGFDTKNYNLFLTASKSFLQLDTTKALSWGSVASAYACLYAKLDVDSLKQLSLMYYNRAKTLDDTSADAKEFYGRLSYRLDTKQVINKDEYDKKFPNGYKSSIIK